jgi:hypothetical protein
MKARNLRTLALMARVARVREILAKRALAEALRQKDTQLIHTDQARARVERSDAALRNAIRGPAIDLSRLPLWQDLSLHVQAVLADEREQLRRREEEATDRGGVAGKQARYRERLEKKTAVAIDLVKQAHEARQLEFATEAWLVRRNTETV